MSNYLAIATVTEALIQLLHPVEKDLLGTSIGAEPPDMAITKNNTNILNIFLYQVTENQGYKNLDLPARNAEGILVKRPLLGLDLHYIITALGTDDLNAQILLAHAMRILHETPYLTREFINQVVQSVSTLGESDLASQVEAIKITHQNMSLEEISKLWSSFFQTNYRLSTTYQVTVVLLESKMETKPTLPVLTPQVTTVQLKQPIIQQVQPQILEFNPSGPTVLTLIGLNFQADNVTVKIDDTPPFNPTTNSDSVITIAIANDLTPGVKTVQIIQSQNLPIGSNQVSHILFKSNIAAFVLAPKITLINGTTFSGVPIPVLSSQDLTLTFAPSVASTQSVSFFIDDYEILLPPLASTIPIKSLSTPFSANASLLKWINSNPGKTYYVRIRVDGAESLFFDIDKTSATYGEVIAPAITVT